MLQLKKLLHYWKSTIVFGCILYLSFAPPSTFNGVPTFEYEDKLVHLLMYLGLTSVLIFDFKRTITAKTTNHFAFVLICLVFPIFLGGAIEILQPMYFAPRSASWFDWFFDIIGVLIGWIFMRIIFKNFKL